MGRLKWIVGLAVLLSVVTVFPSAFTVICAPASGSAPSRQQLRAQFECRRATEQYRNETNREWVRQTSLSDLGTSLRPPFNASTTHGKQTYSANSSSIAPQPSPGQDIGLTGWDVQTTASQGARIARKGGDGSNLHFTWMSFDLIPSFPEDNGRVVRYLRVIDPENYPNMLLWNGTGYNGVNMTGETNRGGFPTLDVDASNHAQVGLHQAQLDYRTDPLEPWNIQFPDGDETMQLFRLTGYDNSCPGLPQEIGGVYFPQLAADRSNTTLHEIAHTNIYDCSEHKLWYWRFNSILQTWEGPGFIDNSEEISYVLAADANSDKVAVVVHAQESGRTNVQYIESMLDGSDWLTSLSPLPRTAITNYSDPAGPQAWMHLAATYDNSIPGALHVMWDEQRFDSTGQVAIKHWNSARGTIRTATIAYWDNPASNGLFNLNLSKLSIGIGDGSTMCQSGAESNNNYVYCIYTQFGGESVDQQNDHSRLGYMNGEVYLVASNSGGNTWSPAANLSNTRTPNCNPGPSDFGGDPQFPDSVCRSEHWASMNRVVRDIDISFISDLDAGSVIHYEGTWQLNPVHYLQLAGGTTDAPFVCPLTAPVLEAHLSPSQLGSYQALPYSQDEAILTIMNLGGEELSGVVSVNDFPGDPSLTISNPGSYSIVEGTADIVQTVTMAANGAPPGLYSGEILISHNDTTESSPRILPIDFEVLCSCPCQHDPQCDGTISDVLDVVAAIGVAFRNDPESPVGNCPRTQYDVDANGVTEVADVVKVINVAFRNQTEAANYVDPCE